jgi:hypothetical protein
MKYTQPMQLTKTVTLKIDSPDEHLEELLAVFSQEMNYASQIVFDNGRPMGSDRLQKATYRYLRNELGLMSQMSCNVARQVSGAYKTLQAQVNIKQTEWQALEFSPTSATFSFGRDFGPDVRNTRFRFISTLGGTSMDLGSILRLSSVSTRTDLISFIWLAKRKRLVKRQLVHLWV